MVEWVGIMQRVTVGEGGVLNFKKSCKKKFLAENYSF
jgi:hypothetical protein